MYSSPSCCDELGDAAARRELGDAAAGSAARCRGRAGRCRSPRSGEAKCRRSAARMTIGSRPAPGGSRSLTWTSKNPASWISRPSVMSLLPFSTSERNEAEMPVAVGDLLEREPPVTPQRRAARLRSRVRFPSVMPQGRAGRRDAARPAIPQSDHLNVLHDVLRGAPGRRLDRLRRVPARRARERRAADDAEVRHLVRHAPAVDDVDVRVVAHPRAAVGVRAQRARARRGRPDLGGARRLQPLDHLLLDVVGVPPLVVVEVVRDPDHRPAERVAHGRVEVEVVVLVRRAPRAASPTPADRVGVLRQPRLPPRAPARDARRDRVRGADRLAPPSSRWHMPPPMKPSPVWSKLSASQSSNAVNWPSVPL